MPAVITKARILDEIQRTATESGGKPLGSTAFRTETGVRESGWRGVFWARSGDALIEAGFQPNQLQRAYHNQELVKSYADLAKELRRIPVVSEVKMKRRSDPSFPAWKPFSRLGNRRQRIQAVASFCQTTPGYDDVLYLCQEFLVSTVDSDKLNRTAEDQASLSYVYLFKSGRHYKLGRSNSAGRREYEIGLQLPEKLITVHVIATDDPTGIEAYWHKRFEAKRMNGEWFGLDRTDVSAFKRRKFM